MTCDKNYTHISVILDSSGSMESIRKSTIDGFNVFLAEQKKQPGKCTFSQVHFSSAYGRYNVVDGRRIINTEKIFDRSGEYLVVNDFSNIENVAPLTHDTFVPGDGTPLFDCIGRNVTELGETLAKMPAAVRPGKVITVILTDGEENASTKYNRKQIFDLITHQREKYGWDFIYLAANQDAMKEAQSYGMGAAAGVGYTADCINTQTAFSTMANKMSNYRGIVDKGAATESLTYSAQELQRQLAANDPQLTTILNKAP